MILSQSPARSIAVLYCLGYTVRLWYSDVAKLIGECRNQHINLENYRGGSCYSKEVQAAEYFLRIQTGIKEIPAFRLKEAQNKDNDSSTIEFLSLQEGKTHLVHIQIDESALSNNTSCKDKNKSPMAQFKLI